MHRTTIRRDISAFITRTRKIDCPSRPHLPFSRPACGARAKVAGTSVGGTLVTPTPHFVWTKVHTTKIHGVGVCLPGSWATMQLVTSGDLRSGCVTRSGDRPQRRDRRRASPAAKQSAALVHITHTHQIARPLEQGAPTC